MTLPSGISRQRPQPQLHLIREQATDAEIGLFRRALGRGNLQAGTGVGQQHAGLGFLELQAAGEQGTAPAAQAATQRGADPTGILAGKHHVWRQHEVGGDHLSHAHVRIAAQLTAFRQAALLHQVLHGPPALNDDEAVRLLDHHPDQGYGRWRAISHQGTSDVILGFGDRQRAQRFAAFFQLRRLALAAFRTGRSGDGIFVVVLAVAPGSCRTGRPGRARTGWRQIERPR